MSDIPLSLCLTLGHNSSAVLVFGSDILIGYENERLSRIKSDSAFPALAIAEIGKYYDLDSIEDVYVSHWAISGNVDHMSERHWDRSLLKSLCPNAEVHSLEIGTFTHHDAHMLAAQMYPPGKKCEYTIVADGFGTANETMSIYRGQDLIHRAFGFHTSLGLLYQYTTAYLGLKMNQDEYKLLGFEPHVATVLTEEAISKLSMDAATQAGQYISDIILNNLQPKYDAMAGTSALPSVRLKIRDMLDKIKDKYVGDTIDKFTIRSVIAFFTQCIVETTVECIIDHFTMTGESVLLTGGLFMNVKLNAKVSRITNSVPFPLCGDISCGLGVLHYHTGISINWPGHLNWGVRDRHGIPLNTRKLMVANSEDHAAEMISSALNANKIVNYVGGAMEFGARALGNTSTFALPTEENVQYINMLNGRETTMPMAGMVNVSYLHNYDVSPSYMEDLEVLKYMITTLQYKGEVGDDIRGCHHNVLSNDDTYTNRVQLVTGGFLLKVLDNHCPIINTSFNLHGSPIVLSMEDVLQAHSVHINNDVDDRVLTIILRG